MAQEVKIAGALFESVPKIQVPDSNDVYHPFVDPSVTTATASDVSSGKVFITADGTETTGTGASTITSTYSSGTVTLNTESVSVAWWGGLNPEFLYEANYTQTLSNMNYADKTPSTSAQTMTHPATTYTSSRNANPVFDRWGSSYHSGSALNFALYDYFILNDVIVNVAYTSTESSLGLAHSIEYELVGFHFIGQRFRLSSGNVISPTSTTYGTTTTIVATFPNVFYRNASNTLYVATTSSYGVYPSLASPSYASTSNLKSNYINFRAPSWSIRTNSTYMNASAWASVDPDNTTLMNRQRLYQVRKKNAFETAFSRIEYMHANGSFPTEVI